MKTPTEWSRQQHSEWYVLLMYIGAIGLVWSNEWYQAALIVILMFVGVSLCKITENEYKESHIKELIAPGLQFLLYQADKKRGVFAGTLTRDDNGKVYDLSVKRKSSKK